MRRDHILTVVGFKPKLFVKTILISIEAAVFIVYAGLDPETGVVAAFTFIGGQSTLMWLVNDAVNTLFGLKGSYKLIKTPPVPSPPPATT